MEMNELLHQDLTGAILKLFYEVYNELGYGFLEKVYQNAMFHELKSKVMKLKHKRKFQFIIKK